MTGDARPFGGESVALFDPSAFDFGQEFDVAMRQYFTGPPRVHTPGDLDAAATLVGPQCRLPTGEMRNGSAV
jgi:hypothetical protein